MKSLWPKANASTIMMYIAAITILSALSNIWYKRSVPPHREITPETVSQIQIDEITNIEISLGTILYQLPPNQFTGVLQTIGNLKETTLKSNTPADPVCSVQINLTNSEIIKLVVREKYTQQGHETAVFQLNNNSTSATTEKTYKADNICTRIVTNQAG